MALSAQEQAELAQLEREVGGQAQGAQPKAGLSADEQNEMAQLEKEVGHLAPQQQKSEPGMISKTLSGLASTNHGVMSPFFKGADYLYNGPGREQIAKVLDYPGGLVRTGLASAADAFSDKPAVTGDDFVNAVKGNAPSSAQLMERMGVPSGPSVNIPYINKNISARDVGGFASDVATNPLTYSSAIAKRIPALDGLLNPAGETAESAGKSLYKSGFKKIDERLLENGGKPFSDVLLENGAPTGTTSSVADEAEKIANGLIKKRSGLYDEAANAGASIDMGHPLQRAEDFIAQLRKDPGLRDHADALSQLLDKYKGEGRVGIQDLSDWKTNLYNALPKTAFNPDGSPNSITKAFQKALSLDFKDAIEGAGEAARPGLGEEIGSTNRDLGSLLGARKPLDLQIRRANTTNAITPVDAFLSVMHPGAEVAKKAADISKTTWLRTNAGKGLMNIGESGAVDPMLRQGLIDALSAKKKKDGDQDLLNQMKLSQ